jgi:hypothetical protein
MEFKVLIPRTGIFLMMVVAMMAMPAEAQIPKENPLLPNDNFPATARWINTPNALSFNEFRDKVVVLHTFDMRSAECIEQFIRLQAMADISHHMDLITVFDVDSADAYQLDRINEFILLYKVKHPVVVMPGYDGLVNLPQPKPGMIMSYFNSHRPFSIISKPGYSAELKNLLDLMDVMRTSPKAGGVFAATHLTVSEDPGLYAQFLIEYPTYLSRGAGGQMFYVTDAGHDRIVQIDIDGRVNTVVGMAGGGYMDGKYNEARFRHPGGTAFVEQDYNLYIADTYNHMLRVTDFKTGDVMTLLGNGTTFRQSAISEEGDYPGLTTKIHDPSEPFGFPTDVAIFKNRIIVASGEYNQLFEYMPNSQSAVEFARIPADFSSNGIRPFISNITVEGNAIYCVLSDGQLWKVQLTEVEKGPEQISVQKLPANPGLTSVAIRDEVIYGTANHALYKLVDGSWKVLAGSDVAGFKDGKTTKAGFDFAFDIMDLNGKWLMSDMANHTIRQLEGKKVKASTFIYYPSSDLWRFADATSGSESIAFDPIRVKEGSRITVNLDLNGYDILATGLNEVHDDGTYPIKLDANELYAEEFTFSIREEGFQGAVLVEMYLTLEDAKRKGRYLLKRAFMNFPVEYAEDGAGAVSLDCKPLIVPGKK